MIIEYHREDDKIIKLQWMPNGEVVVLKTGEPTIDNFPVELRELTPEYLTIYQKRYSLAFMILSMFEPPESFEKDYYAILYQRLKTSIRNKKLKTDPEPLSEMPELDSLLMLRLYPIAPDMVREIGWDLLEHFPSLFPQKLSDGFLEYYFSVNECEEFDVEKIREFLEQLHQRPSFVPLEHAMLQNVIDQAFKRHPGAILKWDAGQELVKYMAIQYRNQLAKHQKKDLNARKSVCHNVSLNRKQIFEPMLEIVMRLPSVAQILRPILLDVISDCSKFEESTQTLWGETARAILPARHPTSVWQKG